MKNFIFIVSITLVIAGCTRVQPENEIYLVLKTLNNPFFKEIEKGIKENIDTVYNLQIRAGQDESDLSFQKKTLNLICQNADNKKIGGLILTPCSSGGDLIKYLKILDEKKIPIILVDTRIDTILLKKNNIKHICFVGSSNFDGGLKAGNYALRKGSIEKILILNGVDGQESAEQRNRGFKSAFNLVENVSIEERTANWNRIEALKMVSGFITSNNDFDCIFGANDEMALGALRAYQTYEKKIPLIIGFDAIDAARESVKSGKLSATVAQNPYKMGETAIKQLLEYHDKGIYLRDKLVRTKIISNE